MTTNLRSLETRLDELLAIPSLSATPTIIITGVIYDKLLELAGSEKIAEAIISGARIEVSPKLYDHHQEWITVLAEKWAKLVYKIFLDLAPVVNVHTALNIIAKQDLDFIVK